MKYLFLIPARAGSKGIPHKNIKIFNGKPLIGYAIDTAREFAPDEDIYVSTDGDDIIKVVEDYGLKVPFKRPDSLATDKAGSYGVMLHAIDFYEQQGKNFDAMVLLQTTSPFRTAEHVKSCIEKYEQGGYDMVVSVCECKTNPYYNCFLANDDGSLCHFVEHTDLYRRQDAPTCYEWNGACYVLNIEELKKHSHIEMQHIGFSVMDELHSVDLDTPLDWKFAELIVKENLL